MSGLGPGTAALLDDLLAHPPAVHVMQGGGLDGSARCFGAWSTERSCYELLAAEAERVTADFGRPCRSLETGSGISTAVLAALGCEHTVVSPSRDELLRMADALAERGIAGTAVSFVVGASDDVLPRLAAEAEASGLAVGNGGPGDLDLVFVDGGHGHPIPTIDAWYGGRRLRVGGVLVLDDVQVPAVEAVVRWLRLDPGWHEEASTDKWASFRRIAPGAMLMDHMDQPWQADAFVVGGRAALRALLAVVWRRVRALRR